MTPLPRAAAYAVIVGLVAGAPICASAQSKPATAVVTLSDGSVFQGELVEKVPGDHVTLKLATGEIRRFEAKDLAPPPRVEPAPPAFRATFLGGPPPYGEGDGIHLRIETNKPAFTYLYQAAAAGPAVGWDRLCLAPCDRVVDPKGLYRVGGEHLVDSDPFRLAARPSQTLYVDATARGTAIFGWIALGLGVALAAPGAYFFTRPAPDKPEPGPDSNKLVGGVLLLNGIPWLVTGIVLFANGTSSTVKDDRGQRIARALGHWTF